MRKLLTVASAVVLFGAASMAQADGLSFNLNVGGPPIVISQPPDFIYPSELGFGVAVGAAVGLGVGVAGGVDVHSSALTYVPLAVLYQPVEVWAVTEIASPATSVLVVEYPVPGPVRTLISPIA